MKAPLLLFRNRALEDRFRKVMTSNHEIGGWLLCSQWYGVTDANLTDEMFGTYADTIHAWIVLPNESITPENSWWSSQFSMAKTIAEATARSMGHIAYFFHTHPTGSPNDPSPSDLNFTVQCCPMWKGCGESVIVQTSPLRVNYYRVEVNKSRRGHNWNITKGEFLSWRSPKMNQILLEDL